ncbi:extracellular catalytic domain type 1 short-chain-length polyhydroxyalkanoate depolymerase [Acidovorax sp. RAC01]|uniref:extracellular catalytic domain type 1 short-chain-length polyhydroxyalkanoate depolymerase n=1 Tax=Acidovorax sp. RAC01 TaxID=1842533 RepID=UPI00083E7187|nr:PHB depolymerase family esterase [Acidovorax sp. RAC01]AOG22341.1 alpha/beta hydrolase fold family protein [Acidovorax sp. RAC01]
MPRSTSLFSLSALTRAYHRNLKVLARATRPPRARPAAKKALAKAVAKPRLAAAVVRKRPAPRKPALARGEWVGGVAPGPAGARRYHLFVPPGLAVRPGEKLPLLLMLHGCGQTGRDLAVISRMNLLAARERFLVLYPEQERVANAHGCWSWFERRSGKADAEAATLLAAVDKVALRYPVDLGRVAVAGLSAGASMAVLMAALFPSRFCAVVMHSGVAPGTAESSGTALVAMQGRREAFLPDLPWAVAAAGSASVPAPPASAARHLPPLLVVHGDADGVVSLRNATAAAALWADALGARPGPVRTLQRGQRRAMRVTDFKARGRTVVTLREVHGLAHAWSGGAASLPYSDPDGPDASALVWAFVARQFQRHQATV